MKLSKELLGSIVVLIILVAPASCGGGGNETINNTSNPTTTTYTPGTNNPGGITYTAGDGSLLSGADDKITNQYNIPDRVLTGINNMFPGTDASSTAKRDSLIKRSQHYTKVLQLTNDYRRQQRKQQGLFILYKENRTFVLI